MRGTYYLNEAEIEQWKPSFERFIPLICEKPVYWSFTAVDLSPANVRFMLTNVLGYKEISNDSNGWEQDTWYKFQIPDTDIILVMYYCGFTFDLTLSREWEDGSECEESID